MGWRLYREEDVFKKAKVRSSKGAREELIGVGKGIDIYVQF